MWTSFDYMYRDAGNFKAFGSVVLSGDMDDADRQEIRRRLDQGEHFIAEQVDVPPLYEKLYGWSNGPTDSDHCWHEFVGFRDLPSPPTEGAPTPAEFLARFRSVSNWDGSLSPHFELGC